MAFISHSDHDGTGNARKVAKAVRRQLLKQGWAVKLDMDDLLPGDDWCDRLYQYLVQCHAAVILLNRAALRSSWVRREVNMLLWRKALGSPVTLIPVLLDGLTSAEIRGTDIESILELQAFKQPGPEAPLVEQRQAGRGRSPRTLARHVGERLSRTVGDPLEDGGSLMDMWLENVTFYLGKVPEGTALRAAAQELTDGGPPPDDVPFVTAKEGHRFLARRMLGRAPSVRVYNALTNVGRFVGSDFDALVRVLAPVWIDPEAARRLLPADGARVVAAVNTGQVLTGTRYVQRASCCHLSYHVAEVSVLDPETFVADCEEAVKRKVGARGGRSLDGFRPAGKDVVYLVVDPYGWPVPRVVQLVSELTKAYAWLNVLLLTGDEVPDEDWTCGEDRITFLRPALDRADEEDADRYAVLFDTMAATVGNRA
ncbi:toll/interleukin-1 receptor domain-containing protein [Streptomyces sp. A012304]|uniref:toll/interleukin-1 receptor domain-containing protein n=1 Tax=Streptomyces sp. A012304 TaxID=375446 RepID=UPI002231FB5B|nr:toll/interleukin-1 receptor domain-containing protein [Streptomyces sp. A012304]